MEPVHNRPTIALSFLVESRDFVAEVAYCLAARLGQERILSDHSCEAEFARPDLDNHLQRLYHEDSELIAGFLSADHETKDWCRLEWRAIRETNHADAAEITSLTAQLMNHLGLLLYSRALHPEAEPLIRRALGIFLVFKRWTGHLHSDHVVAGGNFTGLLTAMGKPQQEILAKLSEVFDPRGIRSQ